MGLLNAAFTAALGWLLFDERLAGTQWAGMLIVAGGISILSLGVKPQFATVSQSKV